MSHGTHYTYNFYVFLHLTEILTKFSPFKLKFKKNQTKVRHKGRNYKIKRVFLKIFFMWCLWGHERPHCLVLSPEASYLACCNSSFSLMKWEIEIFLIDYFVTLCVCAHTYVAACALICVIVHVCACHHITSPCTVGFSSPLLLWGSEDWTHIVRLGGKSPSLWAILPVLVL